MDLRAERSRSSPETKETNQDTEGSAVQKPVPLAFVGESTRGRKNESVGLNKAK